MLTIVLLGDQPLFGPPPRALLDPVPMEDCSTAMVSDIDGFMDEFEGDRRNLLLRLARSWQTVVTGVIDRKDRAAEWAPERLVSEYRQLMERARAMHLGWQLDVLLSVGLPASTAPSATWPAAMAATRPRQRC